MKNENMIEIIERQLCASGEHFENLMDIINSPLNLGERQRGGIMSTVTSSFNYGIIVGKRLEREKHKKNLHREY